ncbi:MFS transporter [Haloprofundus salilacus]|uniref:MFS transporter n=1 Tax=Haloprofundus salilacus TaxID=2876190 RepID=UPI001CD01357|nr:MFS transporter [Haloprofundus salilacus]
MSTPRSATATDAVRNPRRALATVVAVVFVDLLGFGVVIPILPFYVRSFGVSDVFIGLLAASYSVMQFGFAPFLGRLSDQRGRRPVIMLSLAGSAVAWTIFGLAAEFSSLFGVAAGVAVLFVSRMVAGAMGGNIAAAQAYIADITPAERRAEALGLVGASFALGFVFGPAIGGLFASDAVVAVARDVFPAFVPATPFSLPSFAAAGLSLTSLAFAAAFLEEPARSRGTAPRTTLVSQFADALRDPRLRGLVVAFFLVSVAFSGIQVMFIPFAADVYGYQETQTAFLLTYIGVLGVFNQGLLVGRLSRRYRDSSIAVAGAVILLVALAAIPFSPELGGLLPALGGPAYLTPALLALLVVLALLSLGNSLLNVALTTLVSKATSAETQGSAFGVTQGAGSLGRTVGPPAMAALYVFTYWSPFVAGALLVLPILAILLGIARRRFDASADVDAAEGPLPPSETDGGEGSDR